MKISAPEKWTGVEKRKIHDCPYDVVVERKRVGRGSEVRGVAGGRGGGREGGRIDLRKGRGGERG